MKEDEKLRRWDVQKGRAERWDRGQKSEDPSSLSELRRGKQMTDGRGQKSEDRRRKTEDREM